MSATDGDDEGLGPKRAATVRALMPPVLGLHGEDLALVEAAVQRLDQFLSVLPDRHRAAEFCQLLDAVGAISVARTFKLPGDLDAEQLTELVEVLFDRESSAAEALLAFALKLRGSHAPSPWDLARSLRELMSVAYYSNPASDRITGYVPAWRRPAILKVAPGEESATPYTTRDRSHLDLGAIRRKLSPAAPPAKGWFRNDGRPRVAIIGSGPGGACAASELAKVADVVVFDAGARFASREYPYDTLAAMALLYEGGLMTPTRDLDVRVLIPRAVGGGSVMNEGVSVRPRSATLDHWQRLGAGFDRAGLERALDDVEVRQRFAHIAEDRATSIGRRWKRGLQEALGRDVMVQPVLSDLATHASQHAGTPHRDLRGDRCVGCGLCNYGCRFGHHLTVDRTFLYDAEQAGARVAENTRIHHLVSEREPGTDRVRITGLVVGEGRERQVIEADHVVLAAGTPGSPALMLRSIEQGPLRRIVPAREHRVGAAFGFNVGSPAIARWTERPPIPGFLGVQTQYVATKTGDESFILENGHIPPGVMASSIPGLGPDHRRWMGSFAHVGMAVNTIGTPSNGRVDARGRIRFRIEDGTLGVLRETLASLVDAWLHAGAAEVMPAGVAPTGPLDARFDPSWTGRPAAILARLEQVIEKAEHVQIGSGHPQGGLALNNDPTQGVVDGEFRVHGTSNLFVADASLFPTTIVVNLQWLVMGLGLLAGRTVSARLTREASGGVA